MELIIAIIGAGVSITIAIIGSVLTRSNAIALQNRKLKEGYYTDYIEKLHNLAANNDSHQCLVEYTFARDRLLVVASENVVKAVLNYEEKLSAATFDEYNILLTSVIIEIRKDLKIKVKDYPTIGFKKA